MDRGCIDLKEYNHVGSIQHFKAVVFALVLRVFDFFIFSARKTRKSGQNVHSALVSVTKCEIYIFLGENFFGKFILEIFTYKKITFVDIKQKISD